MAFHVQHLEVHIPGRVALSISVSAEAGQVFTHHVPLPPTSCLSCTCKNLWLHGATPAIQSGVR